MEVESPPGESSGRDQLVQGGAGATQLIEDARGALDDQLTGQLPPGGHDCESPIAPSGMRGRMQTRPGRQEKVFVVRQVGGGPCCPDTGQVTSGSPTGAGTSLDGPSSRVRHFRPGKLLSERPVRGASGSGAGRLSVEPV